MSSGQLLMLVGLHEVLMPVGSVPDGCPRWFLISIQVHVLGTSM